MLNLIYGRAGSGKTEFVFSKIKELAESKNNDIVLLTPEQFSFISERRLLKELGESRINCVSNLSFSRLSNEISRLYGGDNLPVLTKGARAVMMKKAIHTVQDSLVLFNKNINSNSFINSVLKIYDEMKSCRVFVEDIINAAKSVEKEMLRRKLKDIALIIAAYDALIDGKYYDSENELTRLYHKLLGIDYFSDKTVFIDGFSGFVAQEYKIIEVILSQADAVYITMCTDTDFRNDNSMFSYVNKNIEILKEDAKKIGCKIESEIYLSENKRANNDELRAVEQYAFSNVRPEIKDEPENISLYAAKNISDECDSASLHISELLRGGAYASDITVICRDLDKYRNELSFSFEKFNIPYFNDERQKISSQPLIMLVNFLLRTIIYSYQSEDVFSLLKTGLTALSDSEINALENYVFVWNIKGSKWKKPFSESPNGFTQELSEYDIKALERLNKSREYIIDIITEFKKKCSGASAKDICKALYFALIDLSADKQLKSLAIELDKSGKSHLSLQQERVWDLLMEILDKLATVGGDEIISIREFYKLFSLMISNEDLGALPTGLDNVQIGSADRIRCNNPKYIFILGANEGEFPQSVSSAGLLSESDRAALINNDFKLYSYGKALNAQELYFAYMALSSATDKLYISYIAGSEKNNESIIVRGISDIFKSLKKDTFSDKIGIEKLESDENAFEILASHFNDNTEFTASLKQYFSENDNYSERLGAVERIVENKEITLSDKTLAEGLYKKDMFLSASRIEDYYKCAFRYFCKFALKAKTLSKAQMDSLQTGTVIHYVLETIIREKGSAGLIGLSKAQITELVNSVLEDFLKNRLGNYSDFSERFKYQFMRLSKMVVFVVERLRDEFEQSDFEAKAFEVKIGNTEEGADVDSKTIPLDDGGSIKIVGAVDRVDVFEENAKKYIRVVDYKSKNKKFLLSDVLNGLNLQMLVYLFTLSESESDFNGISSGILYMNSSRRVFSVERSSISSDVEKDTESEFRMSGLVLNDEDNQIAQHMERGLGGRFIPVSEKDGVLSGDIVSAAQLGAISRKVEAVIRQMGYELHQGNISQNPVFSPSHKDTCDYCDFRDVCRNRREITNKEIEDISNKDAIEIIERESEDA